MFPFFFPTVWWCTLFKASPHVIMYIHECLCVCERCGVVMYTYCSALIQRVTNCRDVLLRATCVRKVTVTQSTTRVCIYFLVNHSFWMQRLHWRSWLGLLWNQLWCFVFLLSLCFDSNCSILFTRSASVKNDDDHVFGLRVSDQYGLIVQ